MNAKIAIGAGLLVAAILLFVPAPHDADVDAESAGAVVEVPVIAPSELSALILSGAADVFVIDVRPPEAIDAGTVRGALSVPLSEFDQSLLETLPDDRLIVLYGRDDAEGRAAWNRVGGVRPRSAVLAGGYAGWQRDVLDPAEPLAEATSEEWEAYRRDRAVADFYLGRTADAASQPPAQVVRPVLRPRPSLGAGEGC